ncbi:MAG: mechanosensitive ion channel [bacterium]|nr:mechanosensitive ion channel [bacterium]
MPETDIASSETLLLAELETRAAGVLQDLRKQELSYLEELQANAASQVELLDKRLTPYRQLRLFGKKDLKKELHKIEKKEDKFRVSLDALKKMAVRYETDWLKENALSSLGSDQLPIGSKYETAALGKSTTQSRLRIVSETLQKTAKAREMWQQRLIFNASDMSRSALGVLADELKDSLQRHNRDKDMLSNELEQVKREFSTLTAYLSSGNIKYQQKTQLETQLKILNEHRTELQSILDFHNGMLTSTRNFFAEVSEAIGNETWKDLLLIAGDYLRQIWGYELFSSNDYPVTVSKLLISVFVFLFGYFSSGAFSRKLAQILADKFSFSQGARAAFEALSFYLLIAIFVTIALRTANVPLTAFTFLGGALAIGIGFGSQNVMNNFISGLILLTEQPIRVGDMIEMETFFGTVKKIGARSTTLRTSTNIDIVVPNSSFLEKSVVNWTRHNTQMQLKVTVGVMYGSDTEQVSAMLLDSTEDLGKVLRTPAPFVLFTEFGDNALIFELRFWANVRNMTERLQVESEVRYRIERLSRERQIVIAYPQRDIHIDTTRPLEIRLER